MPAWSVAIPHYNRRQYAELVLESLVRQRGVDLEIVVSDDASTDDSDERLPALLVASGVPHRYIRQKTNVGYGANLRSALAAAAGDYVLILGNDDALTERTTLADVGRQLCALGEPDVAFTNALNHSAYRFGTERPTLYRRGLATKRLGCGPGAAVKHLRSTSFVGGLIYKRAPLKAAIEEIARPNLFYQSAVMAHILGAGGELASVDVIAVQQNVRVADQIADSHIDGVLALAQPPETPDGTFASLLEGLWLGLLPVVGEAEALYWVRRAYVGTVFASGVPGVLLARRHFGGRHFQTTRARAGLRLPFVSGWIGDQGITSVSTRAASATAWAISYVLPPRVMKYQALLGTAVRRVHARRERRPLVSP